MSNDPIFLNNYPRTTDKLTCGITNIPLTKPAKVFFNVMDRSLKEDSELNEVYRMFESMKIPFVRNDNNYLNSSFFMSQNELDSSTIKVIFKNFKSLKPKLETQWRYLFWEIDSTDNETLTNVIAVYTNLHLPVYCHKTSRGFHFLSVMPITNEVFLYATKLLRKTNLKYPPITLRINPNKYVNERLFFNQGFIISDKKHSDTEQLRVWIENTNFIKIGEHYQLVWYPIDEKDRTGHGDIYQNE